MLKKKRGGEGNIIVLTSLWSKFSTSCSLLEDGEPTEMYLACLP